MGWFPRGALYALALGITVASASATPPWTNTIISNTHHHRHDPIAGKTVEDVDPRSYPCVGEACTLPGHDPSALQKTSDGYYVTLVTGSGGGDAFGMRYLDPADYSRGWRVGPYSYMIPPWITDYLYPEGCGPKGQACAFWAPDLVTSGNGIVPGGDHFIMYYSIAVLNVYGKACIGRATGVFSANNKNENITNPREGSRPHRGSSPSIEWTDAGTPVVCSTVDQVNKGGPHAIDPSVSVDKDGRWWLTYGSFNSNVIGSAYGGGVWMVELDANTGMLGKDARAFCSHGSHTMTLDSESGSESGSASEKTSYPSPFCWKPGVGGPFINIANNPCVPNSGRCDPKYDNVNALEGSYLFNPSRVSARTTNVISATRATRAGAGSATSTLRSTGRVFESYYYLFVNYYWCCRGDASTYEVHVGRSKSATGPFVGRDGKNMTKGGGELIFRNLTINSEGVRLVGPGHAGILYDVQSDTYAYTFDFQGVTTPSSLMIGGTAKSAETWWRGGNGITRKLVLVGDHVHYNNTIMHKHNIDGGGGGYDNSTTVQYVTQIRELEWGSDGWPVILEKNWFPTTYYSREYTL